MCLGLLIAAGNLCALGLGKFVFVNPSSSWIPFPSWTWKTSLLLLLRPFGFLLSYFKQETLFDQESSSSRNPNSTRKPILTRNPNSTRIPSSLWHFPTSTRKPCSSRKHHLQIFNFVHPLGSKHMTSIPSSNVLQKAPKCILLHTLPLKPENT